MTPGFIRNLPEDNKNTVSWSWVFMAFLKTEIHIL